MNKSEIKSLIGLIIVVFCLSILPAYNSNNSVPSGTWEYWVR